MTFSSFNTVSLPAFGGFTPQPWIEPGVGVNNLGPLLGAVDITGLPVNSFPTTPGVPDTLTNFNNSFGTVYGENIGLPVGQGVSYIPPQNNIFLNQSMGIESGILQGGPSIDEILVSGQFNVQNPLNNPGIVNVSTAFNNPQGVLSQDAIFAAVITQDTALLNNQFSQWF
ncbi:MAG: hypothetical protein AAFO04_26745 [Cyanobacteria bacterium J06592_8]